jgi:hypothetical protein
MRSTSGATIRDGDTLARQIVESEYALERRDAASGDDHFAWRSSS